MTELATLPLFPLGSVLYPDAILPLHVFEPRYQKLMRDRRSDDPIFGIVLTRSGREVLDEPEIYEVGTAATLLGSRRSVDGRYDIAVRGGRRFRVLDGDWRHEYFVASVAWLDEPLGDAQRADRLRDEASDAFSSFLDAIVGAVGIEVAHEDLPREPIACSYAIAARLPLDPRQRQALLETTDATSRLGDLVTVLKRERALLIDAGAAGAALAHPGLRFSPN